MKWTLSLVIFILSILFLPFGSFAQDQFAQGSAEIWVVDWQQASTLYTDLQTAVNEAPNGSTIYLTKGDFNGSPMEFVDPMCGNCLEPDTDAIASTGIVIRGKSLTIKGQGESTIIHTNAGYGIYIEDCPDVNISNLSITDGIRDQDGSATDAAIVARRSSVEISDCEIFGNEGDYSVTIAGIGGIMGREGALIHIHNNKIHDNSWDGVALYRGASATIHDNEIWNGRGAGIGITWDSAASVIRNNIHDYWKGIGSFGNTRVGVYNNFVHDLRGWGIVATGTSDMICRNNTVVRCGNVGIAGWDWDAKIEIVNNIVAFNGEVEQWVAPRVGIWMNCKPENYKIANNCIFGNYDAEVAFYYQEFDDASWSYWYERDMNGIDRNIYIDPVLSGDGFVLDVGSPCIDAGDPGTLDPDATASDIGASGGPYSK